MIRKLLLLCALVALASETVYGLGLGKLELRSALNQQFDAEIDLTGIGGLDNDEIIPSLASPADFQRVGIERAHLLTDLRFSVVAAANGRKAIKVTSTRPVVEPYLNFLVEVLWPSGRILREYTVLLDPPVFGEAGVRPIEAPTTSVAPQPRTTAPAPRQTQTPAQSPRSVTAPRATGRLDEGTASDGEYGVTGPGDTLWAIAAKVRPDDSVTVQQTMLAIQRANPRAFINNNINLLKAGHVLRIPDRAEIAEEAAASAVREVRVQNEAFEAYRGGQTQLDASRRQPAARSEGSGSPDRGELRLVASEGATAGERAGAGNDPRAEELSNSLSVAQEDLDRARRANSEMNMRLDDLSGQIETLNEIVKLKDDQLAALRAELQRVQAAEAGAPAAAPSQPSSSASEGSLLTNPFVLGALVLLGIGGAAAAMYMRNRKSRVDEEEAFDAIDIEEPSVAAAVAPVAAVAAIEEEEEELSPQTSDVVGEAEIYIAYGRFPQAITFLQNAIDAEPDRADIQLKLLEVYVQTEDATAFNLQLEQLRSLGDDAATAQALKLQKKIPGAAEAAAVAMGATIVSSEPIMAIDEPEDDDLTFDLDDLDAETEEDALTLNSDEIDDADGLDLDLDLDLEADSSEADLELSADGLELVSSESDEDQEIIVLDTPLDGLDDKDLDIDLENLADADATDDDDAITFDLDEDDDALTFDNDTIELNLDDDDAIDLSLADADETELDLNANDDTIELNLDDDGAIELDLAEESELDLSDDALDLDDSDDLMLNLDEDASTKLELARAYIDMGDSDGARNVLQEVLQDGSDSEVQEANELLEKIT